MRETNRGLRIRQLRSPGFIPWHSAANWISLRISMNSGVGCVPGCETSLRSRDRVARNDVHPFLFSTAFVVSARCKRHETLEATLGSHKLGGPSRGIVLSAAQFHTNIHSCCFSSSGGYLNIFMLIAVDFTHRQSLKISKCTNHVIDLSCTQSNGTELKMKALKYSEVPN